MAIEYCRHCPHCADNRYEFRLQHLLSFIRYHGRVSRTKLLHYADKRGYGAAILDGLLVELIGMGYVQKSISRTRGRSATIYSALEVM